MGLVSLRVAAQRDSMSLSEPSAASRRVWYRLNSISAQKIYSKIVLPKFSHAYLI